MSGAPQERAAFERALRRVLEERYHDHHPFNLRMHEGTLSQDEIRLWVRNRYYYQTRIPIKDGAILAKSTSTAFRREWVQRIHDHDGTREREGGLELWLRLGEAVGLDRESVESLVEILPGVKRACDAYVDFVQSHDLLEAVAASLTEMAAGDIMKVRLEAFERHYPWVETAGLEYFRSRTVQAPRDARYGMAFVLDHAESEADRARCLAALERKCEILWSLLDAVELGGCKPRLASHAQLRDEEEGQTLIVLPERAVRLGGSGREILDLCDGERTAVDIARTLCGRHPDLEAIWDDVHHFIEQMDRLGVLERAKP
jgi:pyrroloquinoline-quinone synthase